VVRPPTATDDWIAVSAGELPANDALQWAILPRCGAVTLFAGTVRDHAEGRTGVTEVEYEAYVEQAGPKLAAVAAEARARCPAIGRIALLHRTGRLCVGEVSVVVVVSAPHRAEAFEAGRWCIDTLKATAPIWKRETWEDGAGWGTGARDVEPVEAQ
jgi:molybdopterin synthase catalytic subunit